MNKMRIIADLATIRQLADEIELVDDGFTTNTADAQEIFNMADNLIMLLENND